MNLIRPLQSLRGIMMLMVFLSHYYVPGFDSLLPFGGDAGVAFFFMLSGYILTRTYSNRKPIHWKRFMYLRTSRVYPMHLIGLALSIKVTGIYSASTTIANLLLVQSWFDGIYFSYNSVSWFLSDLILFYALFPLLLRLIRLRFFAIFFFGITPPTYYI